MRDVDIERVYEIAEGIRLGDYDSSGCDGEQCVQDAAALRRVADRAAHTPAGARFPDANETFTTREPAARPHGESRSE